MNILYKIVSLSSLYTLPLYPNQTSDYKKALQFIALFDNYIAESMTEHGQTFEVQNCNGNTSTIEKVLIPAEMSACPMCGQKTKHLSFLKSHMASHMLCGPVKCTIGNCTSRPKRRTDALAHVRKQHNIKVEVASAKNSSSYKDLDGSRRFSRPSIKTHILKQNPKLNPKTPPLEEAPDYTVNTPPDLAITPSFEESSKACITEFRKRIGKRLKDLSSTTDSDL